MSNLTGGCLCGAVRYELSGTAQMELSCHCRDCQYVSGGAPTHVIIMRSEDLAITKGHAKEYWSTSAKGRRVARLFCEHCGVPLFAKNEKHRQYLAVKVGSLDDPSGFRPQANIWTKSAQAWHHLDTSISRFKENPKLGMLPCSNSPEPPRLSLAGSLRDANGHTLWMTRRTQVKDRATPALIS